MTPSSTHLVLIPSYNPGPKVYSTVHAALERWAPVWVIIDGSTDHSEHTYAAAATPHRGLPIGVLVCARCRILHTKTLIAAASDRREPPRFYR